MSTGAQNGVPWMMSMASPRALSAAMSISTISVASPAVVSVNAMVAPTFPAPRMATFLPLFIEAPFFQLCGGI